ncbi:MAG: BrxE family protein [Acidobacteria bacterium]|nr:BrxE family protein [Acidobacteriota bacterium]
MKEEMIDDYLRLRILVGYLGESAQFAWWNTSFFQPASRAFLDPIFTKTSLLAKYHGIRESARRLHDERIGVGNVFHLFRLPEEIELEIHRRLESPTNAKRFEGELTNQEQALQLLRELAQGEKTASEGPINIGKVTNLMTRKMIQELARPYVAAFQQRVQSFPYFMEDRERG